MSSQPPPPPVEGLGKSTPLVKIAGTFPNMHGNTAATASAQSSSRQQSLTPAEGNHPLAAPPQPLPPPQATHSVVQASEGPHSVEVSLPNASPTPSITNPSSVSPPPPPSATPHLQQHVPPPPPSGASSNFSGQTQATVPTSNKQFSSPPPPRTSSTLTPQNTTAISTPSKSVSSSSSGVAAASPVQSLDDLVDTFLSGPSYRTQQNLPPLLRPPPLETDNLLQCLRTLVERRAWGDVLQVTADLLRGTDSIYAPIYNSIVSDDDDSSSLDEISSTKDETAEIVALQCHAWLKLRRYNDLGQEIARWRFLPFNDNYDDSSDMPSWVPWSLHIIAAETLLHTTDDPHRGTDELHALLDRIPESDDIRWKLTTHRALANAFSRKREWRMAMLELERMLPHLAEATRQELASTSTITTITSPTTAHQLLETAYRTEILSVQGRYLLHAGAVAEAGHLFQTAQLDWNKTIAEVGPPVTSDLANHIAVQHVPAQLLSNEGLLCFAYTNYDQAIECFKNATDTLRDYNSLSPVYRPEEWVGPSVVGVASHASLFNECINNMAICALYTCRMLEAVTLMESLVREDPTSFLTERVAFNLCTMYELGCDTTASARKKRVLQLVAKRFFLHDVGPESFRIN